MCGIAGFIGEDREKIERMNEAIRHRGPDGQGVFIGNGVSLGNRRLAILDPRPEGNQPMWNKAKTAVIVYNGEIYNYRRIKDEENLECETGTDTEVLLKLYEKHGMAFVQRLRGMFALAIYDIRSHTLHLARDPSGIKPLYVGLVDGKLHFASEMRSLLVAFPQKPPLNYNALSQYLRLQYVPGPDTLCDGITSLAPGTVLSWSESHEGRMIVRPDAMPSHFASKQEFHADFPQLMDEVVADHMISDKPVGLFLSGGMDSSILLHHMSRHANTPVRTFTVRFEARPDEDADRFNADAELAKRTAQEYHTDHTEVVLTAELCRQVYRDTALFLDQPNADSVAMAQFVLAKEAKKSVDVILTGAGGDELFVGYPRYRVAKVLHALRFIPPVLRSRAGATLGYPGDVLQMSPGPALAERLLARPLSEAMRVAKEEWFSLDATTILFEEKFEQLNITDPVRALMEFDRSLWLVDESLRLTDATTMASGLEARVPFLDPRIISASFGVPTSWHVTNRETKVLLKQAYFPLLPVHIQALRKSCFFPPMAKWIRREAGSLVLEALEHPRIRELFDIDALRALYDLHITKEKYAYHTLATVTQLAFWFETVYDAKEA